MCDFEIGDRVQVLGKKAEGQIAFKGTTYFQKGEWFGVILDEPEGRNNGSIEGIRYFKCDKNHGVFVRRAQLMPVSIADGKITGKKQKKSASMTSVRSTIRSVYPNYLNRSSHVIGKRRQRSKSQCRSRSRDGRKEMEVRKKVLPIYHLEKDIVHLKETLRSKSEELTRLRSEKEASDCRLKSAQEKLNEKNDQLLKSEAELKDLEKDLKLRRNQVVVLKRELKRSKLDLLELEKKRDTKDEECQQLMEIAETTTIEKEMAEVKYEELEEELKAAKEKCDRLQIELEICKEEMELDSINGVPNVKYVKELEEQNKVMREGLITLKNYYSESKQESLMRGETIKRNTEEIKNLKETKDHLNDLVEVYKGEIVDLQETVVGAASAEHIICNLSEKNSILEQKIHELEEVLNDANDLLDVNNELEEVLRELELEYREEMDLYATKISNIQKVLACALQVVADHSRTIENYREMTSQLKAANFELSDRLERIDEERKVAIVASETLKLRIRKKEDKDTHKILEEQNLQIDVKVAKEKCEYLSAYLPDNFLQHGAEHKAIEVMLMLSKMKLKVDALTAQATDKFPFSNEDMFDITESKIDDSIFYARLLSKLFDLQNTLRTYETSFKHCTVEGFLNIGKYCEELTHLCEKIDHYGTLFSKEELGSSKVLFSFDELIESLRSIFDNDFPSSQETDCEFWADSFLKLICVFCDCIEANISSLQMLTESIPELTFESLLIDANRETENARKFAKAAQMNMKNIESNIKLSIDSETREQLKQSAEKMLETIDLSVASRHFCASQTHHEFNLKQPCTYMRKAISKLQTSVDQLGNFVHLLETGECCTDKEPEPSCYPAVYQRALQKKQEGAELMKNLRRQLECSGQDLIKMMKHVQDQSKELDSARKSSVMAQQLEKQSSDCPSTFDASEASLLKIQLQDFKNTVKFLKEENFRMQCHSVKSKLSDMKSLILAPKPMLPAPQVDEILVLKNKAHKLASQVNEVILPTVVDISKPGGNPKMTLVRRKLLIRQMEDRLERLKSEIADYKNSLRFQSCSEGTETEQVEEVETATRGKNATQKEDNPDKRLNFYTHVDESKLQKLRSLIARRKKNEYK